jgi:hypothetical protein
VGEIGSVKGRQRRESVHVLVRPAAGAWYEWYGGVGQVARVRQGQNGRSRRPGAQVNVAPFWMHRRSGVAEEEQLAFVPRYGREPG